MRQLPDNPFQDRGIFQLAAQELHVLLLQCHRMGEHVFECLLSRRAREDRPDQARDVQEAAIAAQQAAIASIRPGVLAEDVAAAANDVYRERGYQTGYRTGRSIGVAYLEAPELKEGDRTVLKPGMTFAVDGGISVDGVTAGRIGDSVVVTETGYDYITEYPRQILLSRH